MGSYLTVPARNTVVTNVGKRKIQPTWGTKVAVGVVLATSAVSISVPAYASSTRPAESRTVPKSGERSSVRFTILDTYNGDVADREGAAMSKIRLKGATYSRLADLFESREELAEEFGIDPVSFEVFKHAESILDALTIEVDRIRIGLSDDSGLELRLRADQGMFVAAVNPHSVSLERHSGSLHEAISSGSISDEEIARFFMENA